MPAFLNIKRMTLNYPVTFLAIHVNHPVNLQRSLPQLVMTAITLTNKCQKLIITIIKTSSVSATGVFHFDEKFFLQVLEPSKFHVSD